MPVETEKSTMFARGAAAVPGFMTRRFSAG